MSQSVLLLMPIVTGFLFFAWPLRMNQSGLPGVASLFAYASVATIVAAAGLLLTPSARLALRGAPLAIGLQAGILNALGALLFTIMLSSAGRFEAPRLILIVVVTQITLTGLWSAYQAGTFEPRVFIGFITALVTVWLMR